ncbi:MAG: hypothetical protein K0U74_15590 [Alphaproteobacteria bacterium]|nr:hypothetical protein [Alphaproteobacteria bacterium]
MSDAIKSLPFDANKADLLVCPLTGRPILRAKSGVDDDELRKAFPYEIAVKQSLHRPGQTTVSVWIAEVQE